MRVDNNQFEAFNNLAVRSPIFVIELSFDDANTDIHYLTSHPVNGLTGNIINDTLKSISSTSQKITPEKALSTIGSISFECLDFGLTELQRTKLQSGDGLKGKRVRIFKGFRGLNWSDYVLIQTQIISSSITFLDGVYEFQCADIQRQMRKDIFDLKETSLSSSLTATATTINVYDTTQFEMVKQPGSPSGVTDAPGQTVGYLKIEHDDAIEIIRYTGKTSDSFTGCTRGVLGTRAIDVAVSGSDADKSTKVQEYVYLEMAAPKLIYALLTGVLYGQPEGLPDHWHLGLAPEYVKTSDFESIGSDWWDLANNDNGVPAVIRGVAKTDGKRFIEQELLVMLGAFSPIYTTGEIGIRRLSPIIGDGGYGELLDETNIIKYGELKHDLNAVINKIIIGWNYIESRDGFTRRSVLIDPDSIAKHGESEPLELNLRALESSRHSYSTIKNRFDALRERYAGPPLRLQLTLVPTMNALEVGDIVRVRLDHIQDFTQNGSGIARNFEIQKVQQNWITGEVKLDLFGSSDVASAVPESSPDTVIETGFYNSVGTEINATNFPGQVSSSNGITTITGTITLNGTGNPNDSGSVFYCNEDLTLNSGATINLSNSPQLRVNGFFQVNGTINGNGRGFPGGQGVLSPNSWGGEPFNYDISKPYRTAANNGTIGFPNPRQELQRGARYFIWNRLGQERLSVYPELDGRYSQGLSWGQVANTLYLEFNGSNSIEGLPSELRASSGAGGNSSQVCDEDSNGQATIIRGSNGGASGCGIIIICKGADIGANGLIDTSGEDAEDTTITALNTLPWANFGAGLWGSVANCSGAGGSAGVVYWLLDGVTANPPSLNASNSHAFNGRSKDYVYPGVWDNETSWAGNPGTLFGPSSQPYNSNQIWGSNPHKTATSYFYSNRLQRLNAYQSLHKIQFITGIVNADNDIEVYSDEATFSLTEYTNTPETAGGDRSTIEVSISPPGDDSYYYSQVQYRKQGATGWTDAKPSNFESTFEVKSDGTTYEVRTRSVSKAGKVSPSGAVQTITVTDVATKTNLELAAIYPFSPVTNIRLQNEAGSVFSGRDATFEWDDDNNALSWFAYYLVEVISGGIVRRSDKSVSPIYNYDSAKNALDYKAANATSGYFYDLEIRVTPVSKYRNTLDQLYSGTPALFAVSASNVNDPENLRFLVDVVSASQTADWNQISNTPSQIFDNTSYFNLSDWVVGTVGGVGDFYSRYTATDNEIVSDTSPHGYTEPVYQLTHNANSNVSLTSYAVNITPDKTYRLSFWFKVVSGTGEIRPRVYGQFKDAVGNPLTQYNFAARSSAFFNTGEWVLFVGYVKAKDIPHTSETDKGFYLKDGSMPTTSLDTVFDDNATLLNMDLWCRSMSADFVIRVCRPRLESVSGSEPNVNSLIAGSLQASELFNSQQQWSDVSGDGRPEDNADVTANNTSADVTAVNGISSVVIRSAAALVYRNSAETGEFDDWTAGTKTTIAQSADAHSGAFSVLVTEAGITSNANNTDEVVKVAIPEAIIMSFAGRKIRISAVIKQPTTGDTQFASFNLITPDTNPVGLGLFGNDFYMPNYSSWSRVTKDIDVATVPTAGNYYLGINPDRSRTGKSILIDSILIEPVVDSADIIHEETQHAPQMLLVSSAGSKVGNSNSNLTTSKVGTGHYRINYTSGYSGYPIIVSPHSNAHRQTITESAGYITVKFYDGAGALVDTTFSAILDYRYGL